MLFAPNTAVPSSAVTPADIAFDFDSTLVEFETLDELIALSIRELPIAEQAHVMNEVKAITDRGMNGDLALLDSMRKRLEVAKISQNTVQDFGRRSTERITLGIPKLIDELQQLGHRVMIVSGGFLECIEPVRAVLRIDKENCFANRFIYDESGFVVDIDSNSPLAYADGKSRILETRSDPKRLLMVGDGRTDIEVFESGIANDFIGFAVHQKRQYIVEHAPLVCYSINECKHLLEQNCYL